MSARFRALGTFELKSRNLFVIFGDVREGVVRAGMVVNIRLNSELSIAEPIHSVEYLGGAAESHVALTLRLDQEERELMQMLNIGDEELRVEGGAGHGRAL